MNGLLVKKQVSKWFALILLAALFFAAFSYSYTQRIRPAAMDAPAKVFIEVKPGMNAEKIANLLYENKIIDSVFFFRVMAKFNGLDNSLKAGGYALDGAMSYAEIIGRLAEGRASLFNITIPEGYSVDQIAALLEERGIAAQDEVKSLAKDFAPYDYISPEENSQYIIEGFLFPDTYEVAEGQSAEEVLTVMAGEFDRRFTPAMRERAREMNLTIRQVVTLASLVEKEAKADEDRPVIAQVFLNRMREDMPLQSCATIQYILGHPKAELTIQDTRIESPYNTYQHMGLPPGPIANPGEASLEAVLFSEPTEYLYFVADANGKHHFSKTYDEHLAAIDRIEAQ